MNALVKTIRREPILASCLVILAAAFAYLPFVGGLGFYNDDWFTLISKTTNIGLRIMHLVDRPVMGWAYVVSYRILGDSPLGWHLYAFLLRAAGGLVFLWTMRLIWPEQRRLSLVVSILFVIYPGFLQQPSANNYSNHLLALLLALVSIWSGIKAIHLKGKIRQFLRFFSTLLVVFYPLIYEGMIGLEAFRLILYGVILEPDPEKRRPSRFYAVIKQAWPQLLAVLGILIWRLFFFKGDRANVDASGLLGLYLADPIGMFLKVIIETGRDLVETTVLAWGVPANKLAANAGVLEIILPLLFSFVITAGIFFYSRVSSSKTGNSSNGTHAQILFVGLLGVIVTLLPVTLANRSVDFSYSMDRYTLQSSAAAVLVIGAFLSTMDRAWLHWGGLGLFIGLAMVTHFNNGMYYQEHWRTQQQVWWQLTTRAPQIKEGTVLMVLLPDGFRYSEGFQVMAPANAIYYPSPGPVKITSEVLNKDTVDLVIRKEEPYRAWRGIEYIRDFGNLLFATMPTRDSCLHVVDGRNVEFSGLEDPIAWQIASNSRVDQIVTNDPPKNPPELIFGKRPPLDWCTLYQQASLARQRGDYRAIEELGDKASRMGLHPVDVSEWLPFLEGYAQVGRMQEARTLADLVKEDPILEHFICETTYNKSVVQELICR